MAVDLKALGIEQMSVEEKCKLIGAILDSIAESDVLSPPERELLDHRLDEYEAGGVRLIPAERVIAKIRARLKKDSAR
jgi:putative addiction module component (TIGR02574 family)